ncbi:S-layer homology domain-containing protein [Lysinibacillus telephonicus]|uniref:CAP and S-layer homology domain-containing protein n=1 Tax=Lysinibacillus telephonicus TaxID=1714840 RepID=UPI0031FC46AB
MILKKILLSTFIALLLTSNLLHSEANASNVNNKNPEKDVTVLADSEQYYYTDVSESYWAADSIKYLVDKGYMQVYKDGSFKPNRNTTRGEAAYVIAKMMGISLESTFKLKAKDVPTTHPYYKEIRKLAELGVIQNNEYFNPTEPLKRSHISKMIALAFGIAVDNVNKTSFTDYSKNYWAKNYIESLADVEIINGTTSTSFSPNQYVSRAHLAGLTVRGMEFRNKINRLEVAYDYLSKDYISTINSYTNWTNEVIKLVNEERKKAGLSSLNQDASLNQLAIIKAQDMINRNYFEHNSPYYGQSWDMATLFDYDYTSFGENIARNFQSPKEVMDAWMASDKHRSNILNENYTNIGIGIKPNENGNFYWVQLFSSK